jgi:hypothetical protein
VKSSQELRSNIIEDLSTLDLNSIVAPNQLGRIAQAVYKLSELVDEEQYQASLAAYAAKESGK